MTDYRSPDSRLYVTNYDDLDWHIDNVFDENQEQITYYICGEQDSSQWKNKSGLSENIAKSILEQSRISKNHNSKPIINAGRNTAHVSRAGFGKLIKE